MVKTLTKYLNEKLIIFPSRVDEKSGINQRFDEKLIINKDYKDGHICTCAPKTFDELKKIIKDRYDKLGAGTKNKPVDFNDVDVSNIDSFSNENNRGIFAGTKFEYINISDWDVSKVKVMSFMFHKCKQLKSVGDLSNWNVSKVENMWNMFYSCKQLKSVGDLSNWDVSKVKDMFNMFKESGITNIPKWYKK